jgi:hypothetical protein
MSVRHGSRFEGPGRRYWGRYYIQWELEDIRHAGHPFRGWYLVAADASVWAECTQLYKIINGYSFGGGTAPWVTYTLNHSFSTIRAHDGAQSTSHFMPITGI